jgi:transposase
LSQRRLSSRRRLSNRVAHRRSAARSGAEPAAPKKNSHVIAIENAFAKLKALLRKAAERTVDGLWTAIGRLVDLFPPAECRNYFAAAGYDAT